MIVLDFVAVLFAVGFFGLIELFFMALSEEDPWEPIEEIPYRIKNLETLGDIFAIIGYTLLAIVYLPAYVFMFGIALICLPFQGIGMVFNSISEIKIRRR